MKNIYPNKWDGFQEGTTFNKKSLIARLVPAGGPGLEIIHVFSSYDQSRGHQLHPSSLMSSPRACSGCFDTSAMKLHLFAQGPEFYQSWALVGEVLCHGEPMLTH